VAVLRDARQAAVRGEGGDEADLGRASTDAREPVAGEARSRRRGGERLRVADAAAGRDEPEDGDGDDDEAARWHGRDCSDGERGAMEESRRATVVTRVRGPLRRARARERGAPRQPARRPTPAAAL